MYIYHSIVQPRIDNAITIWVYSSQQNINKVQRLKKRVARILTGNYGYVNVRGVDIVKRLKLMNVIQRQDYFTLSLVSLSVLKCIHGMLPLYVSDCITMCSEVAVRNTRASTSHYILMVPYAPLEIFKNSSSYRGPATWNALPECIRTCTS